ncbi:hypothetical protein TNCV_3494701 [Trichonephila clavipes]|nr:hypothetical protein TNCV_3494701 [Trichonephila clavipes]
MLQLMFFDEKHDGWWGVDLWSILTGRIFSSSHWGFVGDGPEFFEVVKLSSSSTIIIFMIFFPGTFLIKVLRCKPDWPTPAPPTWALIATREGFGDGACNFEPWSSDVGRHPSCTSPNYHTTPTGGTRFQLSTDLTCIVVEGEHRTISRRPVLSGFRPQKWAEQFVERRQSESVGRRNSRSLTFLRSDWASRPFARREVGGKMD